jgi:hypothetical protein
MTHTCAECELAAELAEERADLDLAKSVIRRLLTKLDDDMQPDIGIRENGERIELRNWLMFRCFGSDHELYDDIIAVIGAQTRRVPAR